MYLFQSLSWFLDFGLYPFCRPKNTLEAIGLCGPMSSFKLNSPNKSEPSKVTRQWTTRGHAANISPQQLSLTHYSQTQAIFFMSAKIGYLNLWMRYYYFCWIKREMNTNYKPSLRTCSEWEWGACVAINQCVG